MSDRNFFSYLKSANTSTANTYINEKYSIMAHLKADRATNTSSLLCYHASCEKMLITVSPGVLKCKSLFLIYWYQYQFRDISLYMYIDFIRYNCTSHFCIQVRSMHLLQCQKYLLNYPEDKVSKIENSVKMKAVNCLPFQSVHIPLLLLDQCLISTHQWSQGSETDKTNNWFGNMVIGKKTSISFLIYLLFKWNLYLDYSA